MLKNKILMAEMLIFMSLAACSAEAAGQGMPRETGILAQYIDNQLTPVAACLGLVTAFLLGAVHALSPGHGKVMVASYLVGTRGRIRDAVTLGGIVTLTHVISVVTLGVLSLIFAEYLIQERVSAWLGVVSGLMIFIIGYWMLAGPALKQTGSHGHAHHHGHHNHDHPETHRELKSLLALGAAGGMVPCPTAMVVLLGAVAMGKTLFGLLVITSFSLGLAAVLILIGIMTVKASGYVELFSRKKKLIRYLPVLSAGIIMVVGFSISFNTLVSAGLIIVNF